MIDLLKRPQNNTLLLDTPSIQDLVILLLRYLLHLIDERIPAQVCHVVLDRFSVTVLRVRVNLLP